MMLYMAGGICAAIIFLWIWMRQNDPRRQIQNGENALGKGSSAGARTRFLRAIALLEAGKGKAKDRDELAAKAHLAVAEIESGLGARDEAASHYRKARSHGAELPMEAILLLAEVSAEKQDSSEEAVEAYFTYLASGPKTGIVAERVYSVLQNICTVTEDMKPVQRKPAAELNRRVIAVSPRLEWAHYYLALACLLDGRAGEAIEEFRQASNLNPARPLTSYWLAVGYLQLARPALTEAIEALESFLSSSHDDARTRKRETRVCAQIAKRLIESIGGVHAPGRELDADRLTNLDRAIHYLEVAIEKAPEDAAIHFDLGLAYRMKGMRAKAEEVFRQASILTPGEKIYMYELGIECSVLGRMEDAIQALERAVELSPEYEAAHDALGDIYYSSHDYRRVVEHLESALGSATRNPIRFALFVRACYQLGDFTRIVDKVDQRKADPSPFDGDADAIFAVGRTFSIVGRPADAISWLNKVSASPEARYFLACAYARVEQYSEALTCFESLKGTSGEWLQKSLVQRAHVLWRQGDAKQARSLYQSSAAADRNNFEAIRGLGKISLDQGELTEAISHLGAAVALRPESVEVRYEFGIALERSGELNEALSQYQAAVDSHSHAKTWLRIGVVQCRLGRFADAIRAFESCEREEDRSDTLLFYRGLAFAVLGNCEHAIRDWADLRQRHPDSERLGLNLARVHYVLGSQFLAKGKPELAIENWDIYLKCYPMDENVCGDIAELHFRIALEQVRAGTSGAFESARMHLAGAIQRDPKTVTYRLFQALFNAYCGTDVPGAINVVRALADENQQDDPALLYHVGWCLLQNGQASEAAQMFERVRNMPNRNGYARYASWALTNMMISDGNFEEAFATLTVASSPLPRADREVQQ